MLKKNRIVMKVENLTSTHITNKQVFSLLRQEIAQNYTKLDHDFANLVVLHLQLDRKIKNNSFF